MFSNGSYATVWREGKSKSDKVKSYQISTQRKKDDGTYETDFQSFVTFVGKAKDLELHEKDRIKIVSCGVRNSYNKEKGVTYTDFIIFEAEKVQSKSTPTGNSGIPDGFTALTDDDVPF